MTRDITKELTNGWEEAPTKKEKKVDKKVLTFFLIALPTILAIGIALLHPPAWWASVTLAFYQFVMLKQFLDNYYSIL